MRFRLFKIKGITINIHITWLIVFFLFTWSLASGYFPAVLPGWTGAAYWALGALATVLLFAGVLLHELAHSLVSIRRKIKVESITLFIFGGVSSIEREPQDPTSELLIALAGPLVSLVIAGFSYLIATFSPEPISSALFSYLFWINLVLAGFNLIPAFPLDGGRVLRAILWKVKKDQRKATRIASAVGLVFAYLLILLGFFWLLRGDLIDGIWFIILGWFLQSSTEGSYQQLVVRQSLEGLQVLQIMSKELPMVPPNISLEQLAQEHFLDRTETSFLVAWGDQVEGIVTLSDMRKVPRDQWARETVRTVMTPLDQVEKVSPGDSTYDALMKMTARGVGRLPVMENGQVVGIITRQGLLDAIRIRAELRNRDSLRGTK